VQVVKHDLLAAVMPLIDAAAATGTETAHPYPTVLAFALFGQGVAYFQGAQTLIAGLQPAEALPLLRGVVTIAARFEQITEEGSEGLGLVIRLALDSLTGGPADSSQGATKSRADLLQTAVAGGLAVPDHLRPVESSSIWQSLAAEMQMAQSAGDYGFGIIGLHISPIQASTVGFETRKEPGPFTDLIASACVIAQLELLRHAAPIFGWTIDTETINTLITEAREMNETSARSL
jgi:hypothetical protein